MSPAGATSQPSLGRFRPTGQGLPRCLMRWIATAQPGTMEQVMGEQVDVLREQMVSTALLPAIEPGSEGEGGVLAPQRHWMRRGPPAHVFMHPPHGGDDVPL